MLNICASLSETGRPSLAQLVERSQIHLCAKTHRAWSAPAYPGVVALASPWNIPIYSLAAWNIPIYSLAAAPRSRGPRRGWIPHVCLAERRRRRVLGLQLQRAAGDGRHDGQRHPNRCDGTLGRLRMWLDITCILSICVKRSVCFTLQMWRLVYFHVRFSQVVCVWAESESIHMYCACDAVWHDWRHARLCPLNSPEYTRVSPSQYRVDHSDGVCARERHQ